MNLCKRCVAKNNKREEKLKKISKFHALYGRTLTMCKRCSIKFGKEASAFFIDGTTGKVTKAYPSKPLPNYLKSNTKWFLPKGIK